MALLLFPLGFAADAALASGVRLARNDPEVQFTAVDVDPGDTYGHMITKLIAIAGAVAGERVRTAIETVKVVKHTEKQYYGSLTDTPAKIIQKQTVKGIDAFSGATITSEAIINATAKALAKGIK